MSLSEWVGMGLNRALKFEGEEETKPADVNCVCDGIVTDFSCFYF